MTAAPNYTTDAQVTLLRSKYLTPQSQVQFETDDVISLMDDELRSTFISCLNSVREEYWVTNFDQSIVSTTISYTIPQRASGGMLRDIVLVDPNGNQIECTRLSPVQIKQTFPFGLQLPLYTFGYYLQDDQVFLYPQQSVNATAYTLRMRYLRRPNNLTQVSNCGRILTIASNVLTLDNLDSTWTTSTTFDIIQDFPQFNSISDGATITAITSASNQITLTTVPTGLAVGMYVCPTLMSCIPQIPYEFYGLLINKTIMTMASSLGDSQGFQLAEKNYNEAKNALIKLVDPRVQGGRKIVVNRNSPANWGVMGTGFIR